MNAQQLREYFNRHYTAAKYARFLELVEERSGVAPRFRHSETPCFFDAPFLDLLSQAGARLIHQLVDSDEYRRISDASIPDTYRVPNEPRQPLFVQVDFGVVRGADGRLMPKLVEIQGFPSLYAYQPVLARAFIDAYELPGPLKYLLSGLDDASYWRLLGRAILGGHDPENVILLEIDPAHQKTRCDFSVTERMLGVRAVCITNLKREGNRLFYERDGRLIPIKRIYNRAIVDELERRHVELPFDWRDDLNVEWAGHPNFYFRISKFSIPFLDDPCVPRTVFLDEADHIPDDLENWALKPLYSFAGLGVSIGPARAQLDSIAGSKRSQWILQERVDFTPVIETPHGFTKAEIRVMYIWQDELRAVNTIIRMGRGKMMGVDHNKDMQWVGASATLYPGSE